MTYIVSEVDGQTRITLIVAGGIDRSGKMVRRIDKFTFIPEVSYTTGEWSSQTISLCPITYLVYCVVCSRHYLFVGPDRA
jgi:hypothetical protein